MRGRRVALLVVWLGVLLAVAGSWAGTTEEPATAARPAEVATVPAKAAPAEPAAGTAGTIVAEATAFPDQDGSLACEEDLDSPIESLPAAGGFEPAGACRILPQCWTDADCDAVCGPGQGRCVHSKCPVRICKCR